MKKKTLDVRQMGNMLMIDGEVYEPIFKAHYANYEELRFRHIDKRRFKTLQQSIAKKLRSRVKAKDILESALADMSLRALERINKELSKKRPKIQKVHGCFELEVGSGRRKTYIPVR
jgi:hypothetical protein